MSCFRRLFITMCILWLSCLAYAQSLPDSVDATLKPLQGAEKLKAIPGCLMALYQHTPPYLEKLLELGNEGILLAQQLGDQRRHAIINLHMARGYYHAGIYDSRPQDHLKTAITRCEQTGNTNGAGVCNMYLGDIYLAANNYNQAANCYQKAVTLMNSDEQEYLKETYISLSACYINIGDYTNAVECCSKALNYAWELGDKKAQAKIYNNIGGIHKIHENYDLALLYYKRCLDITGLLNDKKWIATSYNNIGNIYNTKNQNKKALEYYTNALEIWQSLKDKQGEASTLNNIALIYKQERSYNLALEYYKKSLTIWLLLGNSKEITTTRSNIAMATAATERPDKAIMKLDSVMVNAEKENDPVILKSIYFKQGKLYAAKGDYKTAYEYAYKHKDASDKLQKIEAKKQLITLELKYRENEDRIKLSLAERDIQLKTTIIFALSGLLIMLSVAGLLAQKAYRSRIRQKNAEVKSRLLRNLMNPHFLFNALSAIQGNILKGEDDISVNYLSVLARLLREVLEVSDEEYITIEQEREILGQFCQMQQLRFKDRFDYDIQVDPDIEPDAVSIPPMLLQPLVENAIEHGLSGLTEKGAVLISFSKEDGQLVCKVCDNGIGINRHLEKEEKSSWCKDHKSFALGIIRERLGLLSRETGKKATLEIVDMQTINATWQGTLATIKIPLKEHY